MRCFSTLALLGMLGLLLASLSSVAVDAFDSSEQADCDSREGLCVEGTCVEDVTPNGIISACVSITTTTMTTKTTTPAAECLVNSDCEVDYGEVYCSSTGTCISFCFGKTSIYKGANLYDGMVAAGIELENMTTGEAFCVETESHDLCTTVGHAWCVLGADGATQEAKDSSEMNVGDVLCDGETVTDIAQETDELFLPRSTHAVEEVVTLFAVQFPGCDFGWDGAPYAGALNIDALILLMLEDCPALTFGEITSTFMATCATSADTTDTTCTSNECLLDTPFLVADALCPATAAKRAELEAGGGRRRGATANTTSKHAQVFAGIESNMDLLWYEVAGNASVYDMAMGALGHPKGAWSKFAKRGRVKHAGKACEHVTNATECGARKDCGTNADGSCVRVRRGQGKQKRTSYAGGPKKNPGGGKPGGKPGATAATHFRAPPATGAAGATGGSSGTNTTAVGADTKKSGGGNGGATTTAAAGATPGAPGNEASAILACPAAAAAAAAVLLALAASV